MLLLLLLHPLPSSLIVLPFLQIQFPNSLDLIHLLQSEVKEEEGGVPS